MCNEHNSWPAGYARLKESTKMNTVDKFHELVDSLIALQLEHRALFQEQAERALSSVQYALEFCTVKCDIGRSSGKTRYIKLRATERDVVVVATLERGHAHKGATYAVYSVGQIKNSALRGKKPYETIFIEDPTFIFRVMEPENLYGAFVRRGTQQTFVQLGA